MWEPQLAEIARFEPIAIAHPGHGRGTVPPGPVELPELGRRVLAELDARSVERASFCGLSLGGAVGIWLAANHPERIDRLVLACTRARFGEPGPWLDRAAAVRAGGMEAIVDAVLEHEFTPAFRDRARWRAMMASIDPEGYARCCELLARIDLRGELGRIEAPTLVLAGAEDETVSREDADELVSGIPGARLTVIEDAAHIANVEQPEAFTRALLSHLEDR